MSPPKSPKLMAAMEKSVPPNSGLWCKVGSIAGTRPPQGISPKLCSRFVTRPVVHRQNVWPAIGRKQMSELFKFPDVCVRQGNFNANSCGNINAAGTPNSEILQFGGQRDPVRPAEGRPRCPVGDRWLGCIARGFRNFHYFRIAAYLKASRLNLEVPHPLPT